MGLLPSFNIIDFMNILPIGAGRVSTALQLNRSLFTIQGQNSLMARYEQQIQTQQRYQYGSDAPFDASVTLSVQMQIERKQQNATNLSATQSYLSATDSSLSKITAMLDESKSYGLDAINTTTSSVQRQALAQSLKQVTKTVFDFGNTQFRDRFLFSGATTTTQPFLWGTDAYTVTYTGSVNNLYSWSDANLLSQTNMTGAEAFGAVSKPVKGTVDLNPAITGSTLVSTLNGGKGIQAGPIRLTYSGPDGVRESLVDLSKCVTVDDVRKTIAKNAPAGTTIQVGLTANGLSLDFSSSNPKGTLTITEVGTALTAHTLGIYAKTPIASGTKFTGSDINPALTKATTLDSLLGSSAQTTLRFPGSDNDLVIQTRYHGDSLNGLNIAIQSNAMIPVGSEYADYDAATNTVVLHIHPDNSTAANCVAAINKAADEGKIPPISATIDPLDFDGPTVAASPAGNGLITMLPGQPVVVGTLEGGTGESFDKESGLQVVNGGKTHIIDFSGAKTIDDLLTILNDPQYGLYAEINAAKTGINVQSRVSGADFMIGENGGKTATQLGIRTLTRDTWLSELDFHRGVMDFEGPGTNATATYQSEIANSGLFLAALAEGPDWNGFDVIFTPTTDPDGNVTIAWSPDDKTITIGIVPGVTRACEVVAAFNEQPGPNQAFEMMLDGSLGINTGQGVVYEGKTITDGGMDGGIDFIITRNDGTVLDIDIHQAKTVGDVIDMINEHQKNTGGLLVASLSKDGNGIELTDHSIGPYITRVDRQKLSTAACDLGLVPRGEEYAYANSGGAKASAQITSVSENSGLLVLAHQGGAYANGVKIEFVDMNLPGGSGRPGFTWDAASQTLRFEIEPGQTTAADIVKLFEENASPAVRQMFVFQNGVNPDGTTSNGSGLVSLFPQDEISAPVMSGGTNNVLTGRDPNPLETESIYTALIRLQIAMEKDDIREIERATNLLDKTGKLVDGARADIGVWQHSLDTVQYRLEDEYVQLQMVLTNSFEIDVSQMILEYSAAMLSYEATLQTTSRMFQMSLLNYI